MGGEQSPPNMPMTQAEFDFWFNLVFVMRRYMRGTQGRQRACLQDALLYAERKWRGEGQ